MPDLFFAIYIAGLAWKDVDDATKSEVVKLSKALHEKAPDREYSNQKVALRDLEKLPEFKKLVNTLNSIVNEERLEQALDMVSGKGTEEEE